MPTPIVSVVIPVKDRRESMLRCLEALIAQDFTGHEILVLDNESSDGTGEACRSRAAQANVPVRVERLSGTVGALRNAGAGLAAGRLLAFTDSDCQPAPGWLGAGVTALERDPGLGVLQGRTLPGAGTGGPWPATLHVDEPSGHFESANIFFRRDALLGSAGFDETVGHYWEDTAAGWAVLRGGWRAGFAADAVVYHEVSYPGFRWHLARAQRNGNAAEIVRRYPELRRELLWGRWFLRRRNATVAAAAIGLALAPVRSGALALALPYALLRGPRTWGRGGVRGAAEAVIYDAALLGGMVRGSLRHRSVVL
ncbi:MAG TPA: glycosyltransferase [Solirubrobacteraceae bacterium]|nr:glycosyltransferase [Solirubrobacteraceae bacterium]